MSTADITQFVDSAIKRANDTGAHYGFEMAKLAVIGLLYDEAMAAIEGRGTLTAMADLVLKVKALQLPQR